ncbi:MAG: type I methionyl aminopeptidase [Flavobacteriales bacterium]|nr:type I methionyl aminopeptidase [Flavobacteriales bacterium]
MVYYKTDDEIELVRESSLLVGKTLAEVAKCIEPGIKTEALNKIAEEFILDNDAIPGFKGYSGFPATLCISVNSEVVHGIPGDRVLEDGDIVSIDCGVLKNSFYGDSAFTFAVGDISDDLVQLLRTTKESLYKGLEKAKVGGRVGDIGHAVQTYVEERGYTVVRELVGHGLGKNLHEGPEVPNYGKQGKGLKLQKGLVIAVEPMINMGKKEIIQKNDGWTIRTKDDQASAHFEHSLAINNGQPDILSTFEYIEEVLKKKNREF